ncbi:PHA/PHB synthase family protein [Roseicella aquatilis]|uniref:Class I poly(R)-hydroxyalkanoic acid synthase n=1 Tax=Roseicella aquatilis TaxID=2527868 RepID=A0A4R4D7A8_9PROT|nr:class I poly(R)-hydroxyalkanoic acid synthase [Roseicella aquatilis]TCZ55604.1 class I poly(R)-hydroxyalkanoic acid synthase [Roseicella aquatilis]
MADQGNGKGAQGPGFGMPPGAEAMLASLASWTAAMPAPPAAMLSDAAVAEALRQAKGLIERDPLLKSVDAMWNANPLREVIPVDWAEVARALRIVWLQSLSDPANTVVSAATLGAHVFRAALDAWGEAGQRWLGEVTGEAKPNTADKRFAAPEWQANPVFRTLKEAYLLASDWLVQRGKASTGLEPAEQQRLEFHLRQFVDAMSPTLLLASNPVALKRAMETGGASLANGTRNLLEDLQAGRLSMVDETAFAPGRNLAMTPGKVVHRNKLVELIQYSPQTETVHSRPILILPPWINKFYIMDMQPKNSLIGFLVKQGFTVFVVSWKNPDASMEDTTIEDYVDLGVLETSDVVRQITGSETLNVMGYCIGGTLLAMTLAWLAAEGDKRFHAVTFMVSLQDFSRVGDTAVFLGEGAIDVVEAQMMQRGYLDSREMSNMFNLLRSNDLIWANVVNNYLLGEKPPAFDLLYWNSDGTRMCRAAHAWYLRNTYVENNLVKPGKVVLKGRPLDLGAIRQDIYAVGAEKDHIVPWDAAWQITRLAGGKVRYILGSSGHIAGIINPPGGKGSYWVSEGPASTPAAWRGAATKHDGSWWTDWSAWLAARAGRKVKPPTMGSAAHPPLEDAPGTYVLQK